MAKRQSLRKTFEEPTLEEPTLDPNIQFSDEGEEAPLEARTAPGGAQVFDLPVMTQERNQANQEAARRVVEKMKQADLSQLAPQRKQPPIPPLPAAEEKKLQPKIYRVLNDREIARGGSKYRIPMGKVLSANQYDIADLRRQGVVLEEIEAT